MKMYCGKFVNVELEAIPDWYIQWFAANCDIRCSHIKAFVDRLNGVIPEKLQLRLMPIEDKISLHIKRYKTFNAARFMRFYDNYKSKSKQYMTVAELNKRRKSHEHKLTQSIEAENNVSHTMIGGQ